MKKQNIETIIIPLIDCEKLRSKKKLDYRKIIDSLIDEYGRGTELFRKFSFFNISSRFSEQDEMQVYKRAYEISLYPKKYSYIIGQSGLFLKTRNSDYASVLKAKESSKKFITFCKKYLFVPIGIAHFPDGDSYLKTQNGINLYNNVELFDKSEVQENA